MDSKMMAVLLLLLGCSMHSAWSQTTTTTTTTTTITTQETTDITDTTETTDITETTERPEFSCLAYEGTEVDLLALSGYWYEVARYPAVDDTQCLSALLLAVVADNEVNLQVAYISNSNGQWVNETSSLPWNDNVSNGIFNWSIGGLTPIPVTYKLVSMEISSYALFCGYKSNVEPVVPVFKLLTRHRHLSEDDMLKIQSQFESLGLVGEPSWVEQSQKICENSGMRTAGGAIVALALALIAYRRNI